MPMHPSKKAPEASDKKPSPQAIEIAARMLAHRAMRETTAKSTTMLSPSELESLRQETRQASEQMREILASQKAAKNGT